jgi:UDP-N-acetylmuramoyl-tripeptide--D-alanyl-D-alanine ligase
MTRTPHTHQSLTTLLAILQQSEYESGKLAQWVESQTQTLEISPKDWTLKLKTIQFLTTITKPLLGEMGAITFWSTLISYPQYVYFSWVISRAQVKLRGYQKRGLKVVCIAGSYAKTSTKSITAHILSGSKNILQTPGNINVMIGIARVILHDLQSKHEVFVVELGEYNPGDIKRFTTFLEPSNKILTPIGLAHLERFGTPESLQKEFLSFLTTHPSVPAIVHEQNRHIIEKHQISGEITYYGPSSLRDIEISRSGTEFEVTLDSSLHAYIPLLGEHNAVNTLPGLILGQQLHIPSSQLLGRLRTLQPVHARLEATLLEQNILMINNGYNSNPGTAIESLKVLGAIEGSQKIVITPGFVEMGEAQEKENELFGERIASVADYVGVVTGANEASLLKGLKNKQYHEDHIFTGRSEEEIMNKLQAVILPNAVILFENSLTEIYKS